MSISFNTIPANIRTPGQFIEISNALAVQGTIPMVNRNLIIAQMRSSGAAGTATANTLYQVTSVQQAEALFGHGSILAGMVTAWMNVNPFMELWAEGYTVTGAVSASGTVAFSGTATVAGQIYCYIAGQRITASVNVGDTATVVGASLASAITAYCLTTDLPVSAASVTGTVTVTALENGPQGNSIDLRLNYNSTDALPPGITAVVTTLASGTGTPSLTSAISAIGNKWFTTIVTDVSDSTNIAALESQQGTEWGPTVMQDGQIYFGVNGSSSTLATAGAARNSKFSTLVGGGLSPTPPWIFAADAAACDAGEPDASRPRQTLLLPDCLPPAPGAEFSWAVRNNTLLSSGVSTFTVNAGQVFIDRLITTYQTAPSGIGDISYLSIETMRTLAYIRYTWRGWVALKFPRHKLAADGTLFDPSQPIVTPSVLKTEAINWYQQMIDQGQAQNKALFAAGVVIQLNPSDPGRLDMIMTPVLMQQFRALAGQVQYLLSNPVTTALAI